MKPLADQSLLACNAACQALSQTDIDSHLNQLSSWTLTNENNIKQIIKSFKFKNFLLAQQFTNKVADLAEQENHHPKICLEWGNVTISWWTHSVSGLFINDFIMAAKCDVAYAE